jgi:uncharacterized protein YifN (PemK superfamily)
VAVLLLLLLEPVVVVVLVVVLLLVLLVLLHRLLVLAWTTHDQAHHYRMPLLQRLLHQLVHKLLQEHHYHLCCNQNLNQQCVIVRCVQWLVCLHCQRMSKQRLQRLRHQHRVQMVVRHRLLALLHLRLHLHLRSQQTMDALHLLLVLVLLKRCHHRLQQLVNSEAYNRHLACKKCMTWQTWTAMRCVMPIVHGLMSQAVLVLARHHRLTENRGLTLLVLLDHRVLLHMIRTC